MGMFGRLSAIVLTLVIACAAEGAPAGGSAYTAKQNLASFARARRSAVLGAPRGPQQASGTGTSGGASKSSTPAKKKTGSKKRHATKREPTQKAPTPDRITEIQGSLARAGYYQGNPTGKWDANTVAAMQKFQSENGLDATGKIDALSLQKLGLGSSVAGVSAPKPAAPPAPAGTPSRPNTAPATQPPAKSSVQATSGAETQTASSSGPAAGNPK
jgi:peptidoglycan hydrolase-like protein with peptidoglycan-binding domain